MTVNLFHEERRRIEVERWAGAVAVFFSAAFAGEASCQPSCSLGVKLRLLWITLCVR